MKLWAYREMSPRHLILAHILASVEAEFDRERKNRHLQRLHHRRVGCNHVNRRSGLVSGLLMVHGQPFLSCKLLDS